MPSECRFSQKSTSYAKCRLAGEEPVSPRAGVLDRFRTIRLKPQAPSPWAAPRPHSILPLKAAVQQLTLNGRWSLFRAGRGPALKAHVPGTVHQDLLDAGLIADPYYRDNERLAQWVGEETWVYRRSFEVPKGWSELPRVVLCCAGLDTLATLTLNGEYVGTTDNMHRAYEFDVAQLLRDGKNELGITFSPVLPYLHDKDSVEPRMYGWTSARLHDAGWLRKEPCNFGWDWGPQLLTCGIWRDISLVAIDSARLGDVGVRQRHARGKVTCDVEICVEASVAGQFRVALSLTRLGQPVATANAPVRDGRADAKLVVPKPELWWPNGLGDQPLYDLEVELYDADEQRLDRVERRVGLRTLELRTRRDRFGESFEFVVNGVSFFAKGANWIPADTFAPRVTRDDYARLLKDARYANMNMLRVWGGGIYEADVFYDLCDELGLCIWQDFMFACGTYPSYDAEFMENVRVEAEQNIKRLRHHACLALFCGNNEIEQGLVGDSWTPTTMSWADYDKLFGDLLAKQVARWAPDVSYWPGSPHTPGTGRDDFNNADSGDAHLWGVWHGKQPFEWYRQCRHRFVSEFGFQSFPHPKTVRSYTRAGDRNITSPVMEHHQRSPIGNTTIVSVMTEWFLMPKDFESTLWLSQIQQGMAMKYACEHWRRNMPRSMGALYWQLNDCWPVASWSSIDSLGRHKALHYMARHFFAPRLVSGVEDADKGEVAVFVCNDAREKLSGMVRWFVTTASGQRLAHGTLTAQVGPGTSRRVGKLKVPELLARHSARGLLVWLELHENKHQVSENLVTFARPKQLSLEAPEIETSLRQTKGAIQVTLKAKRAALWCWLDLSRGDARFSDNFFHLRPGQSRRITIEQSSVSSIESLERQLVVKHLGSTNTA